MNTPLVSVVLPTFNRAHVLERAVASVLAQTYRPLELLVVDDGSTDDTQARISGIADPRLRYLRLSTNRGVSNARNVGVENARGEWLAFQDSDDEWLVDKIEGQIDLARQFGSECMLVGSGLVKHLGATCIEVHWPVEPGTLRVNADQFVAEMCAFVQTALIRTSAIRSVGGFDPEIDTGEDWELIFRMAGEGGMFATRTIWTVAYDSSGSLSNDLHLRARSFERMLAKHHEYFHARRDSLAKCLYIIGTSWFQLANGSKAIEALAKFQPLDVYYGRALLLRMILALLGERRAANLYAFARKWKWQFKASAGFR